MEIIAVERMRRQTRTPVILIVNHIAISSDKRKIIVGKQLRLASDNISGSLKCWL
jgi:hypothetical protein